ncbi:JmjC domain-containing protein [Parafrankia elaeagni]|uniref:JmjC domain-containing protein n=1 Tax=Parafrankia elaeagni TaxID=222534 RepID=UPI0018A85043|nr:cupin domain-containing protein [Parafrankia elaeagni]
MEAPISTVSAAAVERTSLFSDGYTIVLNSLHLGPPAITALAHSVAAARGARVGINAYVSPRDSRGFGVHYDSHDALIIQIDGVKTWTILGPRVSNVQNRQPWQQLDSLDRQRIINGATSSTREQTLAAGDVLYLPRGTLHAAQTTQTPSIHLTVAIHPVRIGELLSRLVRLLDVDGSLVGHLPIGFTVTASLQEAVSEVFDAVSRSLAEIPNERLRLAILGSLQPESLLRASPLVDSHEAISEPARADCYTVIQTRRLADSRPANDGWGAVHRVGHRPLRFPLPDMTWLTLTPARTIRRRELLNAMPARLADEVLRALLAEGVLVPSLVDDPDGIF